MRIVGGKYRHRLINFVIDKDIRASKDRVREAIFNALGQEIDGKVLDLFCGFGGYGLESLSRGASYVTFLDYNQVSISCLKKTIKDLKIDKEQYEIIQDDFKHIYKSENTYDYIFLDPPYKFEYYDELINFLFTKLLNKGGRIIIESNHPLDFSSLNYKKSRQYIHRPAYIFILEK